MYAIIEEGGGQRKVSKGDEFLADLLSEGAAKPGTTVTFDKVLLVSSSDGSPKIGLPYLKGATVTAEVLEPLVQGEKLHIVKFRRRKNYRRKTGHRQTYTRLRVTAINA